MKRFMVLLVAMMIVMTVVGGAFAASTSESVTVNGSVSGLCKPGTSGVMSFSIPDPSAPGPIAATITTDASVFCSNGAPFTVQAASTNFGAPAATCASLSGGITGQLKDGANTMNYTFTCGTAGGTGAGFAGGNDQKLTIAGSIAQAAYINAPVSALYADTILLTISY